VYDGLEMKLLTAAIAAALIAGIGGPALADPTISITQTGNTKAAAAAPLTFVTINSSRGSIVLTASGGCGASARQMKPAARIIGSCPATDGKSTIAAMTYPAKQVLCVAHINRQAGINYTTFESTTNCRERESLNHIEIVVAPLGILRAPHR
jgi:hypothetical protein